MFCVLNAEGQVIFANILDKLTSLQERFVRRGIVLQEFFIDNCCAWRLKLQNVFGRHLKVYLDIFHTVQRITRKIPKRHPFHQDCLKSLQLVFRDPSDQGAIRTKPTPDCSVMQEQMCKFRDTWKNISCNGEFVLPPAAINEIRCLLVHINRGCLSGINPGCGTTKNERLHRELNSHMVHSRYGVELAYA